MRTNSDLDVGAERIFKNPSWFGDTSKNPEVGTLEVDDGIGGWARETVELPLIIPWVPMVTVVVATFEIEVVGITGKVEVVDVAINKIGFGGEICTELD